MKNTLTKFIRHLPSLLLPTLVLMFFIFGLKVAQVQPVKAAINTQLNYQGKITDSNGVAVADGTYNAKFVIYDAASGGNCLWTAVGACDTSDFGTTTVTTVNGIFSTALGTTTHNSLATSSINWNSDSLYLGVTIRGTTASPVYDSEMTPRKRLTSSPYAFNTDLLDGYSATTTAAASSTIPVFDKNLTLNLFAGGVSSTRATTTNIIFGGDGSDITGFSNLYVSSGNLFFDGSQINTGGVSANDWQVLADTNGSNYLRPTTTVNLFAPSRLGVGTTTPQALLSVTTSTGALSGIQGLFQVASSTNSGSKDVLVVTADRKVGVGNLTAVPDATLEIENDNATDKFFEVASSTNSSIMVLNKDGYLGLSTSTPDTKVDVYQTGYGQMVKVNNDTGVNGGIGIDSGDVLTFGSISNNAIAFKTNNTEKVRITTDGLVGIGTDAPSTNLHIAGTASPSTQLLVARDNDATGGATISLFHDTASPATTDAVGAILFNESKTSAQSTQVEYGRILVKPTTVTANSEAGQMQFWTANAGVSSAQMTILENGDVGMGTELPAGELEIEGAGAIELIVDSTSAGASVQIDRHATSNATGVYFLTNGTVDWFMGEYSDADGDLFIKNGTFNSTVVMTFDDTNNHVGVGPTAPAARLDVDAESNTSGIRLRGLAETVEILDIYMGSAGNAIFDLTSGNDTSQFFDFRPEDDSFGLLVRESDGTGTTAYGNLYVTDATDDYLSFTVTSATDADALNVTASDRVGVGTSTPAYKFVVEESDQFAATLNIAETSHATSKRATIGFGLGGGDGWVLGQDLGANGTNDFYLLDVVPGGTNTTRFYVSESGNVGIGTTTPIALFQVGDQGAGTYFSVDSSGRATSTELLVGTTQGLSEIMGAGDLYVGGNATTSGNFTVGTSTLVVQHDPAGTGNNLVGVGTTTPWRTLSLTGTLAIDGLSALGATASAVCITSTDEVQFNSGVADCTVSSQRFKNSIADYGNGLETIQALSPVTYKYNWDETEEQIGLIAEEVEKVDPRLVAYNFDGQVQSVKQLSLIGTLIGAVQQQQDQIDNLKVSSSSDTSLENNQPLSVIDNPDSDIDTLVVRKAATFYGSIYVRGEANFEHKVVFKDDVEVHGKLYVSSDQAGTVTIPANATSTEIIFDGEYAVTPKITASIQGAHSNVFYGISDKTPKGFRVVLAEPVNKDLSFDWIALALAAERGKSPEITELITSLDSVGFDIPVEFWAKVTDEDTAEEDLTYQWEVSPNVGTIDGDSGLVYWTVAPGEVDEDTQVEVTVTVSDGGNFVSEKAIVKILAEETISEEEENGQVAGAEYEEENSSTATEEVIEEEPVEEEVTEEEQSSTEEEIIEETPKETSTSTEEIVEEEEPAEEEVTEEKQQPTDEEITEEAPEKNSTSTEEII